MLERKPHIPELYDLKHRNDSENHKHYDYETHLLEKMAPAYVRKNPNMYKYTDYLKQLWLWMYESVLPIKNFFNYTVDKYYDRHNN